MRLEDARAMVAQFDFGKGATPEQLEAIALYMVATGTSVYHAAWELYGRDQGKSCQCTPCLMAPLGPELTLRILAGRDVETAPC